MKILQVNIFYDEGSTGKIVADIHQRLIRDGHESYVAYGLSNKKSIEKSDKLFKITNNKLALLYRRIARITGLRFNTAYLETIKLIRQIKKINPDIVHLHCLNHGYLQPFILLKFLGKHNYKVLVTHHADITITANCDHAFDCEKWKTGCGQCKTLKTEKRSIFFDNTHLSWLQMRNAFTKIKNLYASGVSDWMSERVQQSPFFKSKEVRTILNGLDTSAFKLKNNTEIENIKKKYNIPDDKKIILHVTPNFYSPIKGGKYVLELAHKMLEVNFVVVGIKSEIIDKPNNLIAIPHTSSKEELAALYSLADITLLTSKKESFSMVTAESLCCGTPVVGFKAGAPETIAIPEYSEFVEFGDVNSLKEALYNHLNIKYNKKEISIEAQKRYSAERMYQVYLNYYKLIME